MWMKKHKNENSIQKMRIIFLIEFAIRDVVTASYSIYCKEKSSSKKNGKMFGFGL